MFAAEVQGSFCELMIVVRMVMLVCIVVPLLCIWEGFCVAIMAMKKELAAVLVLLLAPVTWFYCHMKIHFQIRTWNIKIYMVLSINFILCMHTFYTITYKCYKLVLEQIYSVLEQLPDCWMNLNTAWYRKWCKRQYPLATLIYNLGYTLSCTPNKLFFSWALWLAARMTKHITSNPQFMLSSISFSLSQILLMCLCWSARSRRDT